MKKPEDAWGRQMLAQYHSQNATVEIIERDDGYIATGSDPGLYFREYKEWAPFERRAISYAHGRVLDIGCGAGRHSLYLQSQGLDVTAIDLSPGAVQVCKLRGVKKALVRSVTQLDKFKSDSFDTIVMFGNNFGLFASAKGVKTILRKMVRITSAEARILAVTRNPYTTEDENHLEYHRLNKKRGRMGGQIRMRVRFEKAVGPWFDYLLVSPGELDSLLVDTDWRVECLINATKGDYAAILKKMRPSKKRVRG
jgi:SAM-dependent methyltransferase